MKHFLLFIFTLYLFTGCQSASNFLHSTIMPKSAFLDNAQKGLRNLHRSKYKKSIPYFLQAISLYRQAEDRPLVAISDYIIQNYYGEGYDKVFLHNYNAINYLMLGDIENAKVETKNANLIQDIQREKFYKEITKFKTLKTRYDGILNYYEKLFNSVNPLHTPYQNPFAYYLSALLYEEDGAYDDAYIDIMHALKLLPSSKLFKTKQALYTHYKNTHQNISTRRVELFFDIGKSPGKYQAKVPVKTEKDKAKMLYLPTFKIYDTPVDTIRVVDLNGKIVSKSNILTDVDAIKINEFKEKIPSLIPKILKESSKELLTCTLAQKSSLAAAVVNTANTLYAQYLTATWKNLPKRIEVLSFIPQKDKSYRLQILDKDGNTLINQVLSTTCNNKLKNCYYYFHVE